MRTVASKKIADIPWGPWRTRASFFLAPARPGLLMISHNARSPPQLDHAGIYLLSEGKVEKVLPGWIHGVKVSPDGCKAAIGYSPAMSAKIERP